MKTTEHNPFKSFRILSETYTSPEAAALSLRMYSCILQPSNPPVPPADMEEEDVVC